MILIKKSAEPKSWTEYRQTPNVSYQSTEDLVNSLLEDQGYICAYCMRRIPCRDRIYEKDGVNHALTKEDHRVEHLMSREKHSDLQLQYANMVICCPGHIGSEDHCDRLKGNNDISFKPTDSTFIKTIQYTSRGRISSTNEKADKEINELLNLNTELLVKNRASALGQAMAEIDKHSKGKWTKAVIEKYIDRYSSVQKDGKKKEFCGIIVYMLQKKLRQY